MRPECRRRLAGNGLSTYPIDVAPAWRVQERIRPPSGQCSACRFRRAQRKRSSVEEFLWATSNTDRTKHRPTNRWSCRRSPTVLPRSHVALPYRPVIDSRQVHVRRDRTPRHWADFFARLRLTAQHTSWACCRACRTKRFRSVRTAW